MRVLVFGDSITQGFWDTEGGWVARLRRRYDERQIQDLANKHQPMIFNLGISGDITAGVVKRFSAEVEARKWYWPYEDFSFIFAIGINDSVIKDGVERSSPEQYRQELEALIKEAKKLSEKIMFIGLTPCLEAEANRRLGNIKWFTNSRIKEFDQTLQRVCQEQGVVYLPLFEKLQEAMNGGQHLFDDGLHPNSLGHDLIFKLVQPELDKLLA